MCEEKIAKLYLKDCLSHRDIAKQLSKSTSWVVSQLKLKGLYVPTPEGVSLNSNEARKIHNQLKQKKWNNGNVIKNRKHIFFEDDKVYVAICKETGEKFNDYKNSSGTLLQHLTTIFPTKDFGSKFKRKKQELETGVPWYADYFNFTEIHVNQKPTISCLECNWTTGDINNNGGWLTQHIVKEHGSILDYVSKHPEQKQLFQTAIEKEKYANRYEGTNKDKYVICQICGEKLGYITHSHAKLHGITVKEYKEHFPKVKTTSKSTGDKISKIVSKSNLEKKKYKTSGIESKFKKFTSSIFSLKHQQPLGGYMYDFIDHENKLVIEIDGEYWHGYDRESGYTYHQISNVLRDVDKTNVANNLGYKVFRIRGNVIKSFLTLELKSHQELLKFLEKFNSDIYKHRLLNLKEYDIIISKEYCNKNLSQWKKEEPSKLIEAILKLWKDFYAPNIYIKSCIDLSKRRQKSIWIKGIMKEAYYESHKRGSSSLKTLFLKDDLLKSVIKYRIGLNNYNETFNVSIRQLYKGIEVRTVYNVGVFPVKKAKELYAMYNVKNRIVYDPFAGWGSRLIACMEEGAYYNGNDNNLSLKKGYKRLIQEKNYENKCNITFEDSKIPNQNLIGKIDFIMTSPPFYDDEYYGGAIKIEETEVEWFNNELLPVFINCYNYLKPGNSMVIDMNDIYVDITIKTLEKANFKHIKTEFYKIAKSHYQKRDKNEKKQAFIHVIKPL